MSFQKVISHPVFTYAKLENWRYQQTKWYIQKVPFYDEHYLYQTSEL